MARPLAQPAAASRPSPASRVGQKRGHVHLLLLHGPRERVVVDSADTNFHGCSLQTGTRKIAQGVWMQVLNNLGHYIYTQKINTID